MSEDTMTRSRRKVQQAIEKADAEYRQALLLKRIELANNGIRAFKNNKPLEAAKALHTYLRILEDWKGVAEGSLNPSLFDPKKDSAELLLISAVYWDLVRLYDHTKTAEKKREFLHYLEKYILFSKGMRHQVLCAETMRKYLGSEKPLHREDLKQAYKLIATNKCFIATELCDVVAEDTIPALRLFRDQELKRSRAGRIFVAFYYRNGPRVARFMERRSRFTRKAVARALDAVAISYRKSVQ